mmetsp:Transcript_25093/g.45393  ORF Transcript_25093/g.45393 Transcript_25093/m.45393 type:complete len:213 (-) Transcript_25093:787-1425(-)
MGKGSSAVDHRAKGASVLEILLQLQQQFIIYVAGLGLSHVACTIFAIHQGPADLVQLGLKRKLGVVLFLELLPQLLGLLLVSHCQSGQLFFSALGIPLGLGKQTGGLSQLWLEGLLLLPSNPLHRMVQFPSGLPGEEHLALRKGLRAECCMMLNNALAVSVQLGLEGAFLQISLGVLLLKPGHGLVLLPDLFLVLAAGGVALPVTVLWHLLL